MLDAFRKRMERRGGSLGMARKNQADMLLNAKFRDDIGFREVIITHIPTGLNQEKFDARYAIKSYLNITGDEVPYFLHFRPGVRVPIGSYVDIKDDTGVYETWMIVAFDDRPQFPLYQILKCNWTLKWVHDGILYKCLGVKRNQNSYNSGLWTDYTTTSVENQHKMWLPTTPYSQTINYGDRVLMNDAGRAIPLAWQVSKVEDTAPIGITKLTFAQVQTDMHEDCGKFGIANWCKLCGDDHNCANCQLPEPEYIDAGLTLPDTKTIILPKPNTPSGKIVHSGTAPQLRANGNFKKLTAQGVEGEDQFFPIWTLTFKDRDEILCTVTIDESWSVTSPNDCTFVPSKEGGRIDCSKDGVLIFSVNVAPDANDTRILKIKCAQLYSMVGKVITASATDEFGRQYESLDLEVIS